MQRTLRVATLAATLIATLALPVAAGKVVPFTFYVTIGSSCMQGTGPVSSTIELTLMDRNNNVIDTDTAESDSSGNWHQNECFWYNINGSDKVRAESGPDSRTFLISVITTVIMAAVGVLACAAPARRALRVQPTEALRQV